MSDDRPPHSERSEIYSEKRRNGGATLVELAKRNGNRNRTPNAELRAKLRLGMPEQRADWLTTTQDPEVVLTRELSAVLDTAIKRINARSGAIESWSAGGDYVIESGGRSRRVEKMPRILGGATRIALDAGCDTSTITKIIQKPNDPKWTSLSKADALLSAAGESHAIHDGRIRVVPNPGWSDEKWRRYRRSCDGYDAACYTPDACLRLGRCCVDNGDYCPNVRPKT